MDPSYNNSFGSFSSGGASGVISVSGSAPVTVGEKKSKKVLVIVLMLVAVLAICSGVIAYFLRDSIFGDDMHLVVEKTNEIISLVEDGSDEFVIDDADNEEFDLRDAIFAVRLSEISDKQKVVAYYKKLDELSSELQNYKVNDEKVRSSIKNLVELAGVLGCVVNYAETSKNIDEQNLDNIKYTGSDPILRYFSESYFAYYKAILDGDEVAITASLGELRDPIELMALSNTAKNIILKVGGVIHE